MVLRGMSSLLLLLLHQTLLLYQLLLLHQLLLLPLAVQVAGPVLDGLRGMSSLLLESEDAGYLLQVCGCGWGWRWRWRRGGEDKA
jgi:hypothetical protein